MEQKSTNVKWHNHSVGHEERVALMGHQPAVLWYTGLSGSGKSTIANAVDALLHEMGCHTYLLDGDNVRHGLNGDLGFSDKDRVENIRRIGEVAKLFIDAGLVVSTAFISPFQADRKMVREMCGEGQFIEVFVDTPLDVCESRDPKGLYKKARNGEIRNFTGIDSDYEAPLKPEVHLKTAEASIEECARQVVAYLVAQGLVKKAA
ncbi:adenylyl-sulfate kinase [Ferrimonas balearica]|uniref:adenylyl-sulfate kinase n=1 Tax=Ferrimonas balearica TaxID=44012 RepID=UPI001C995DF6|nr:adenylyl-sulfate kinase [Ferrimonas balearica]MBY5921244.1 adenylyl-sulfate kinase [Ferrimonas balearica]MBY5996071.1 adenylyl-sulfate kinase [Ferrimonas balearica]